MNQLLVYQVLKDSSEKWPLLPAVYDEFGALTFSELYNETETLKKELIALGVTKGMGIGVMARNGRNFITAILQLLAVELP